ncbi:hypothetical protein ASPWEDRAFT_175579 [Aspergillus wentii DTO 134E9]|uniref:Carrier domain-containing protein n=1 Tax=Aspergillus wentii DTO 134E9 TaxID=1073089 RepID=A0A1L9RBJ0_ASPWE|nr:uncharacterized protein ASPWEDRAFT_175579 [Aspergillus wentii DTO 134E9]OJJ32292.1 hypothetical protein ASPWEDRAFT_175579 [Aspergillus wentii DTO 134E9]
METSSFQYPIRETKTISVLSTDTETSRDGVAVVTPKKNTHRKTTISIAEQPPSPTRSTGNCEDEMLHEAAAQCHCSIDEIEDIYACTALQEGMMALTFKDSSAYTIEYEYQLPSGIDCKRLHEAWQQTARASPILRTRIISTSQRACLQVVLHGTIPWLVQSDNDGMPSDTGIAWRAGAPLAYFILNVTRMTLKVVLHHSVCDDWSMALLLRQADAAYRGESLIDRPFRPLVDYVERTRAHANEFWATEFRDAHQVDMQAFPPLPTTGYVPRPTERLERTIAMPADTSAAFTINTKLRLAWALLQSLYTGSDDVFFGAVSAGRGVSVPGAQELCGPALATIPVRVQLNPEQRVSDALATVQGQWAASMEFEHVGLQNLLHLGPGPEAACQFQTLLSVEPRDGHQVPALFSQPKSVQRAYDLYSLILRCRPLTGGMWIELRFDPAVIEAHQTKRILSQFIHIYQQIEKEPYRGLSEIESVSSEDREQLALWNVLDPPSATPPCVHQLIAQRTHQQPHSTAISSWDGDLSYQKLDDLSGAFAARLVEHSVGPGAFVPLCLEKSKWMAVAMLGVMKAGGAFVLLDSTYPMSRLQEMCQRVNARLIVASQQQIQVVSELGVPTILAVDQLDLDKTSQERQSPRPVVGPSDNMYVTFTSGSTGTPKGVIVTHAGYAASALAHGKPYHFTPESRVLQFASPAFDSCIIEHLSTLMMGGCICIPSAADCHSNLEEAINQFAVSVACLTPTVTRILSPDRLSTLKVLAFVGEAVLASDIARWKEFVQVRNAYGPAECSAVFSVQPNLQHRQPTNIGFPTGGVGWVVHPRNHQILMPVGCPGELVIEGLIVGNGYLASPEQTAQAFIKAPVWRRQFGAMSTPRMYKTGDLVQAAGDGSFRYLGRKDTQVKLHGQRLELAEIEHHLRRSFPHARQAVVEMLRPTHIEPGDSRPDAILTAFVCLPMTLTPEEEKEMEKNLFLPPNDEFRAACASAEARLSDVLPAFMVPRIFLPLSHMPLTPSGKTNRRYLRDQANLLSWGNMRAYRVAEAEPQRPSNAHEEKLQQIWAQTLNQSVEKIGVNESFFRLGGDSISAMQVAASCQAAGLNVMVADIFRFPTIGKLSQKIQESNGPQLHTPSLEDDPIETKFGLTPVQQLWFEHVPDGHNKFTQEFLLRVTRPTSVSKLRKAVQAVAARHSMLRARYEQDEDGEWTQMIGRDVNSSLRFREHWLPSLEDQEAVQQIFSDSQSVLDIQQGILLVVDLIETETQEQYLGLMAHHLAIDLVSWRVVLQDLEDILTTGRPLQPTSLSFQQWSRLQQAYAEESLDPEVTMATPIPAPPLSYWGPRKTWGSNTWADTVQKSITVSPETTEAILGPANDAFHTRPVEIIHTAILHAFAQTFDNRPSPTIFSEGHGREPWEAHIDVSRTVGWFTTIAPLFVRAKKGQDITELLKLTKDGRRAIPKNGWEYFASRYLHPEGMNYCQGHSPMEILFNYTGLFQQLERPGALLQLASVPDQGLVPMPEDLPRISLIDVTATVMHGSLNVSFVLNKKTRNQDRLQKWIDTCLETLEALPKKLQQDNWLTVSDFPLLSLKNDDQLQGLLQQISGQFGVSLSAIEDIYPCSPIQLGMWLSQVKNPQIYWSHIRWSLHPLPGASKPVETTRIQQAWQQVVDRHPILRTVFTDSTTDHSHPVQVVLKAVQAGIQIVTEPESSKDSEDQALADQALFNQKARPAHQLTVTLQPNGSVSCNLTVHHMLVDGVTENILLTDFHRAYDGNLDNKTVSRYGKYVEYLQSHRQSGSEEYWTQYLEGVSPSIFPFLTTEPAGKKPASLKSMPFNFDIGRRLRSFCQHHGITVSSLFQLAWGLVLRAYTGSESVCFGYIHSCRDIPLQEAREVCGPLINLLICRLSLGNEEPLLAALMEAQDSHARSIDHQHCFLAEVMHSLDLQGQPLFNTAMSLQKETAGQPLDSQQDVVLDSRGGIDFTEYDVTVNITTNESAIHGDLTYWSHALSDAQAELIADTLGHIALQLIDPANTRLGDLNFYSPKNKEWMLDLNRSLPDTVKSCIHSDISRHSLMSPESCAVASWDGNFSHHELDLLSSSLARHLSDRGVGPEVFVPVCFEKSKWIPVAMLAIMKAGGAFILLDPSHPVERLQKMIQEDFQSPVIVTSTSLVGNASRIAPEVVVVEAASHGWVSHPKPPTPSTPQSPQCAAYAVFTSGSTGNPKATIVEHQAFRSAAAAHQRVFQLDQHSRVLQFASYAFDVSILEILTTLLAGGCVCIPSESDRQSKLAETIQELNVNWMMLTPSVARTLNAQEMSDTLEVLVLAGEGMTNDDIRQWSPFVHLMNGYGPSECSVIATVQPSTECLMNDPSNIGHPEAAVSWVVHPSYPNKLMPVGAVGELVIEGPIVGRGYVNRPQQTATSFLSYPAWLSEARGSDKGCLYRTGDMVRLLVDGTLRYVGRKDRQVKLRGQRIELAEIERHVQLCYPGSNPEVFVDLVAPLTSDNPYLVASIVLPSQKYDEQVFQDDVVETRTRLQKEVPSFLIPFAFLPVLEIPRLVNGKMNRHRLRQNASQGLQRQLDQSGGQENVRQVENLTAVERRLQFIWAQVLSRPVEMIGPDDNFFRLGGDSIAVMKLASTASAQGLQLSVPDVFLHPKLRDLARLHSLPEEEPSSTIVEAKEKNSEPRFTLLPLEHHENVCKQAVAQCNVPEDQIEDIYPCTPLQAGLVALTAERPGSYIAHHRFQLAREIDLERLKKAWEKVSAGNSILRTRMIETELGFLQVVTKDNRLHWMTGEKREEKKPTWEVLFGQPLVHFEIIPTSDNQMELVVTAHHAAYDSWALPLLLQRAQLAYNDFNSDGLVSLPFQAFIEYTMSQKEAALQHWRTELENVNTDPFPSLPSPAYRPSTTTRFERSIWTGQLMDDGVSRSTAIKLAWALVQSQYQSSDEVFFGMVSPGRTAPIRGIETMAGPTIATIPLYVVLDENKTVSESLAELQERTLEMIPFEHVGLSQIAAQGPAAARACSFQTLLIEGRGEVDNMLSGIDIARPMGTTYQDGASNAYAVELTVILQKDQLVVEAAIDEHVVPQWEMQRILDQFSYILQQVHQKPQQQIQELSTLNPNDVQRLQQSNSKIDSESESELIVDVIRQHCTTQPLAPAVCAWDGDLSYDELNVLSANLATLLRSQGIGPDDFVPIYMGRSRWIVVAVLAVMKAGAAFVLLDILHPPGRLRTVCQEVNASVIISSVESQETAQSLVPNVLIAEESDRSGLPVASSWPRLNADHALYAVFTSGSTGKPKGAVVENGSFATMAVPWARIMGLEPSSRILHFASYAFDVSILEILGTLFAGACICVLSESERRDKIAQAVTKLQPSHAVLTPSVLRVVTEYDLPSVHTIMLIGEPVRASDVQQWARKVRLLNTYGPAECTVVYTMQPSITPDSQAANIGFPIAGAVWVTDRRDPSRLVPTGAVGELLLQGPLVGRGYLNNPEQTAAAFISEPPWVQKLGMEGKYDRMYRTGDLVRYEEDGSLSFVGRRDFQVKLRGQRFELGEVEEHVQQTFPGEVEDVVAQIVTPAALIKSPCLVVFIVPKEGLTAPALEPSPTVTLDIVAPTDIKEKVAHTKEQLLDLLPDYMIPTAFIPLRHMPKTIGGKVDRTKLRESMAEVTRDQLQSFFAPKSHGKRATATDVERALQRIWARALGIPAEQIGVDDSFFRLGGDSISALQATSQARAVGIDHSVGDLFRFRTILEVTKRFALGAQDRDSEANVEMVLPCTPAQRGILVSQIRDSSSYVTHFIWQVNLASASQHGTAVVDIDRLARAWRQVVAWHPALRAGFRPSVSGNGQFEQILLRHVDPPLVMVQCDMEEDRPGVPTVLSTSSAAVTRHDGQAVPHQLTICTTPTGRVFCRLDINHVIIDAMSLAVLVRDIGRAYSSDSALVTSQNDTYQKYITFVEQQSQEQAREYWSSYLEDMQTSQLPAPRLSEPSSHNCLELLNITLTQRGSDIESFCRSNEWTASNVLYFAWALTLGAFTGSDDVCFGTFSSGRLVPVPHINEAIGQFANESICRVRLARQLSLNQAAMRLQEDYSNVLSYQTFPLVDIARAAGASMRDLASTAVNVQYKRSAGHSDAEEDTALQMALLHGLDPILQDVMLYAEFQENGQIEVAMTYRPSQVSSSLASQLAQYFDLAVGTILQNRDGCVGDLQLLSVQDKQRLLHWNKTLPDPTRKCVHEAIRQRAEKQSECVAVAGAEGDWSYRELDQLAAKLARSLTQHGVTASQRIPICFEKSRWTIVAMLAVLKVGAVLVPLDPAQPVARLQDICRRVDADLIISSVIQALQSRELAPKVMVIGDNTGVENGIGEDVGLTQPVDPEQPAYILYTSGTTGSPKGVMVSHRSYTYAAEAQITGFELDPSSRVLQLSSYSFDVSMTEILTTLIAGATVCVLTEPEQSQMFLDGACPFPVSHAFLTPSAASGLDASKASSWVQTLVLQGEPMSDVHITQWSEQCRLVNGYGPTECTVFATMSSPLSPRHDPCDIGCALGVHCWVVDRNDYSIPLPVGAIGELILSGPSVAHGYLNDPERTAAAFIHAPKWLQDLYPGQSSSWRLYKTGDLVRYEIADGSLRFEGRKDRQIKVRGQRVELGDIEYHTWQTFPGHKEVLVEQVMVPNGPSSTPGSGSVAPRLVACVRIDSNSDTDESMSKERKALPIPGEDFHAAAAECIRQLRDVLPVYMVPDLMMPISQVPLTASGKTDRAELRKILRSISPEDWSVYSAIQGSKKALASDTAKKFHAILTRLLNIPPEAVDADDSFLHFGGDSILAMKIAANARAEGLEISSNDVLRYPTISEWANIVDSHRGTGSYAGQHAPFSLIQDHERVAILSSHFSREHPFTPENVADILPALDFQNFYITHSSPVSTAHVFPDTLDVDRLRTACKRAMVHHSILRTVFVDFNDSLFQVVLGEVDPVFEHIIYDEPEDYIMQKSQEKLPSSTDRGTLPVGFTLVTSPTKKASVLILRVSHAQYDGTSLPLLWEAVAIAYRGEVLPKTLQFREVVYNRLRDDNKDAYSFWRSYLQGVHPAILDPFDISSVPVRSEKHTSARREVEHPQLLPNVTVASLAKAALSWVLSEQINSSDVILGQVVHGRGAPLPNVDKVLGPCLNLLPVRVMIDHEMTVQDLVYHVQAQQLETFTYDYVSFDSIVEKCTSWSGKPKLGCLVHHQGVEFDEPLDMDGVCSISNSSWANSKLAQGQVGVVTIERGPHLGIMIMAAEDMMDLPAAESLAERLARTIEVFSKSPETPLAELVKV